MNDTRPIIEASQVGKVFTEEAQPFVALKDVNLTINQGEFVCLIGPSGCGKSTLLRILARFLPYEHGKVTWDGNPQTAMVFQNFALFPWLSVEDNVGFGLKMQGLSPKKIRHSVKTHIDEIGLKGFETKHPKELSGGMRQRVGIARALAVNPDILFMDEPFSSLDAFTANKLRQDLLHIWQRDKMTVVMVTHLVEEAVELADRIVVFTPRPGSIDKIIVNELKRPRDKRSEAFYKQVDDLEKLIA